MSICLETGCSRTVRANGLCRNHYMIDYRKRRWETSPVPRKVVAGVRNPYLTTDGYVAIYKPEHPNSWKSGYILEHVFIMSEHLGRALIPGENVHHKNGDRECNTLDNLELWNKTQPAGQRVEDKVSYALEILKLYKPEMLRDI